MSKATESSTPLRYIQSKARHVLGLISGCPDPLFSVAPYNRSTPLPLPQSILPSLLAKGLSHEFSTKLAELHMARAVEIKASVESRMQDTIPRLIHQELREDPAKFIVAVERFYLAQYHTMVQQWTTTTLGRCALLAPQLVMKKPDDSTAEVRGTFNQIAKPVLESVFKNTPYPSRDVKLQLAETTGMELRQINVWFQNHRRRSRQAGVNLKRSQFVHLAPILCATSPSPEPYSAGECTDDPEEVLPETAVDEKVARTSQHTKNCLNLPINAPPHAFPTRWPPLVDYEPFPDDRSHLELPWPRTATTSTSGLPVEEDVAALVDLFAALSLSNHEDTDSRSEAGSMQRKQRRHPSPSLSRPTVVSSEAPLDIPTPVTVTVKSSNPPSPRTRRTRHIPTLDRHVVNLKWVDSSKLTKPRRRGLQRIPGSISIPKRPSSQPYVRMVSGDSSSRTSSASSTSFPSSPPQIHRPSLDPPTSPRQLDFVVHVSHCA